MAEYLGDFVSGSVIKFKFNTRSLSGAPITFAGSPQVAVYKDSVTQSTTGITQPSVDYDGVTGLHYVVIDTNHAFYETGKDFDVVVTAGTVDGQSVVGETIRTFSIENRNTKANVVQANGVALGVMNNGIPAALRNLADTTPIRFTWPTGSATITAERSINGGAFAATTGTVSYLGQEGAEHWYTLSYNAADRAVGIVRYRFTAGAGWRYLPLLTLS